MKEYVILVDDADRPIGLMEKMEAHEKGLLHRAFSVFVFNSKKEILLQQRAFSKYHSPGLWTNTCCSHPREGETNIQAGERRLWEEMGLRIPLKELFSFIYKADFDNGLTEHEYDYVLVGCSDDIPVVNPKEVASWKWLPLEAIKEGIAQSPQQYTAWFKIIFDKFYHHLLA
ncbi:MULTISPECIES: isopentenyl-diphosphate Delta-isomerase [unclassified Capnocytophaga]|uniref:isopentenyl-diphosphate Delta-isomerase n=1 Tax=unclassified Capnocytophaga TaxID=2640652 RepID=UPI000202E4FB|nr:MULTISPECIES: isopentenyl-diphosphate Delta-isomerase [unclassified Capnocytophaga]EGD33240.1 isopentenyl-diphosphate delta-isomerase [Capnocytophaga sp. oral taxon 338 str. F0234]MEB3005677.1 isopentenyl-diphosphate Delta-isomerase [Capnocytophaga sp. G2]